MTVFFLMERKVLVCGDFEKLVLNHLKKTAPPTVPPLCAQPQFKRFTQGQPLQIRPLGGKRFIGGTTLRLHGYVGGTNMKHQTLNEGYWIRILIYDGLCFTCC